MGILMGMKRVSCPCLWVLTRSHVHGLECCGVNSNPFRLFRFGSSPPFISPFDIPEYPFERLRCSNSSRLAVVHSVNLLRSISNQEYSHITSSPWNVSLTAAAVFEVPLCRKRHGSSHSPQAYKAKSLIHEWHS